MPGLLTRALFQLLTVNPKHRVSSLQDMRAAPALAGVLWAELSEKKVEPGFVPNVSPRASGGQGGRGRLGTSSVPSSTERPPALRPHLRAGGDDPGVAAAAQEEEASGQEQVPGQQQGQLPVGECSPAPSRLCSGPSTPPPWWGCRSEVVTHPRPSAAQSALRVDTVAKALDIGKSSPQRPWREDKGVTLRPLKSELRTSG